MESDRELLELAARAAGIEWYGFFGDDETECIYLDIGVDEVIPWNPLTDDGDALRLTVNLRLVIHVWNEGDSVSVAKTLPNGNEPHDQSEDWHYADAHSCGSLEVATRRAIVRAAAEIGKGMARPIASEFPEDNYYKTQAEAEEVGRAAAALGKTLG